MLPSITRSSYPPIAGFAARTGPLTGWFVDYRLIRSQYFRPGQVDHAPTSRLLIPSIDGWCSHGRTPSINRFPNDLGCPR